MNFLEGIGKVGEEGEFILYVKNWLQGVPSEKKSGTSWEPVV